MNSSSNKLLIPFTFFPNLFLGTFNSILNPSPVYGRTTWLKILQKYICEAGWLEYHVHIRIALRMCNSNNTLGRILLCLIYLNPKCLVFLAMDGVHLIRAGWRLTWMAHWTLRQARQGLVVWLDLPQLCWVLGANPMLEVTDPMTAEALSLRDGIIFAKLRGYSHVIMETDCLEVVNLWNTRRQLTCCCGTDTLRDWRACFVVYFFSYSTCKQVC